MTDDPDNSDTSSVLMHILQLTLEGRAALAEGDGPRALDILSRKHESLLQVFSKDSGSAGTSLVDLAEALHLVGRQRQARQAVDEALVIFKRLDRTDGMRERLEQALMEICRRQGHSFVVEEMLRARVDLGGSLSSEDDLRRAVEQDELAVMLIQQRRYEEALPLLLDSKCVFEHAGESALSDLAVCYQFLSRVYLHTEQFDESVTYGRQAFDCAERAHGDDSLEATMVRDELAIALAFCARRDSDVQRAQESVALSELSARRFTAEQGPNGKEATRSWENNRRLRQMLKPLLGTTPSAAQEHDRAAPPALPTYSFISHSYADAEALDALLKSLPSYVKPVVFEPIDVPPTAFVSEKLISGVLGADGFIFIDSEVSGGSFWCAFERDLAARKQKHMFRFDPRNRTIEPFQLQPRELKLAHCFHEADSTDVKHVMRWLVDEWSFAAFHDEQKLGELSSPPFASMADSDREMRLFSIRTFGTMYLLFLSDELIDDNRLRRHYIDQILNHPHGTVACWLHPAPSQLPQDLMRALSRFPKEHIVTFSRRPTDADFNVHLLDDLTVRLFWVHHRISSGDWTL